MNRVLKVTSSNGKPIDVRLVTNEGDSCVQTIKYEPNSDEEIPTTRKRQRTDDLRSSTRKKRGKRKEDFDDLDSDDQEKQLEAKILLKGVQIPAVPNKYDTDMEMDGYINCGGK